VTIAQEHAEASERRAVRELDRERTARQTSERAAEDLRPELAAMRSKARDAAVAQAEARARLDLAPRERGGGARPAAGRPHCKKSKVRQACPATRKTSTTATMAVKNERARSAGSRPRCPSTG